MRVQTQEKQKDIARKKYAHRYKRATGQHYPPLNLKPHHYSILAALDYHRVLTTNDLLHLCAVLHDKTSVAAQAKIRGELKMLFERYYIDRLQQADNFVVGGGRNQTIYALGNKGADTICERYKKPRAKVDWTQKNRLMRPERVAHALLAARLPLYVRLACRKREEFDFIDREEILANATNYHREQRIGKNKYGWAVNIQNNTGEWKEHTVVPDDIFGIRRVSSGKARYFAYEADKATESQRSAREQRQSIYKKQLQYTETARQALLLDHFNWESFWTLFITTGKQRMRNMVSVNKAFRRSENGNGWRGFLFATETDMQATADDVLNVEWINGREERVTLISKC